MCCTCCCAPFQAEGVSHIGQMNAGKVSPATGSSCAGQVYLCKLRKHPLHSSVAASAPSDAVNRRHCNVHSFVGSTVTGLQTPSCVSAEQLPVCWPDVQGHPCLVVLPSEQPSSRREAASIEQLLLELLAEPVSAADR